MRGERAALAVAMAGPAALALALAGPTFAQGRPPVDQARVERAIGPWELSNPAGNRKCAVEFRDRPAGPGLSLALSPACREAFPATAGVAAWGVSSAGNLLWLDAQGQPLFDFGETEVGVFEALRPGDPNVYFLTNLGLAGIQLPQADEVAGLWGLGRPGARPTCALELKADLAADLGVLEQRFAVEIRPGCERSIATLGLASWRLERELLMIFGTGPNILSFRREADGRWTKTPADSRPLSLSRQI